MFACCFGSEEEVITVEPGAVSSKALARAETASVTVSPRKITLKQLVHATQQWEFLVEWENGLRYWTTISGQVRQP